MLSDRQLSSESYLGRNPFHARPPKAKYKVPQYLFAGQQMYDMRGNRYDIRKRACSGENDKEDGKCVRSSWKQGVVLR